VRNGPPPKALVFDFDGTIVDTETPVYESWATAYRSAGVEPIPLATWREHIGQADGQGLNVRAILCEQLGADEIPAEVEQHRRATRADLLAAQPIREGVVAWIEAAYKAGVRLAIASSSPSGWVQPHLADLGLASYFPVVSCADPGIAGKPDPAVYLTACRGLSVEPAEAVAIEDSAHGVSAAVAAGMRCIAVPGPITRSMNFDHATTRADSLADLSSADWLGN